MSSEQDAVERLEGTCEICGGQLPDNAFGWQTIHDSPEDCVWALQRSLEASQQEVERLENDRVELAAILTYRADSSSDKDAMPWGLQGRRLRERYRKEVREGGFASSLGMWEEDAAAEEQEAQDE